MKEKSVSRRSMGVMFGCGALAALELGTVQAQPKSNPNFTGGTVTPVEENSKASIAHFRFSPGSRTKWHSHSGGQIILVEEGVGLFQNKGGPVMELRAGETTYCPANTMHWHGAAPNEGGVEFNVTRGSITWGEEVTDQEYNVKPKHK